MMKILRFKINIEEYLNKSQKGLIFFELFMKKQDINQLELFEKLDIVQTSFKFAQKKEQNIGKVIVSKLNDYFNLKPLLEDNTSEYLIFISKLYEAIYYRNYDIISQSESRLQKVIDDNTILTPIFQLFKILLRFMDENSTIHQSKDKCLELYQEVSWYYEFFTDEIRLIYKIVEILMNNELQDANEILFLTSEIDTLKGMLYFALTTNAYISKNYERTIIFGKMCTEELMKDNNFARIFTLQLTMAVSYNMLGWYQLAYDICIKNILTMQAKQIYPGTCKATLEHFYVSCLGLKKYQELEEMILSKKEDITKFEYLILMFISYKNKKSNKVKEYYLKILSIIKKESFYGVISKSVYEILCNVNVKANLLNIEKIFNVAYIELLKKKAR